MTATTPEVATTTATTPAPAPAHMADRSVARTPQVSYQWCLDSYGVMMMLMSLDCLMVAW
jgi:hypothetical protein